MLADMVKNLFVVSLLLCAVCVRVDVATPAFAQAADDAPSDAGEDAAAKAATADTAATPVTGPTSEPPFLKPLADLSEILGSMQFLRTLCGGDPTVWRGKMQALMDAQQPSEAERRRLIASFNAGYRAYESTYRKCTPAALVAVNRYQDEGARLAREIGTRYGN